MNYNYKIWIFNVLLLINISLLESSKSYYGYVPKGNNALLYKPSVDPIMHLDQETFADTVFNQNEKAFLVEYYADWCGHCRAFAPFYRDFSYSVKEWSDITVVAVMNCADPHNSQECRNNYVDHYPMLKYFPRSARNYKDGILIQADHSVQNLRRTLASKILNEQQQVQYLNWPNFNYMDVTPTTQFNDLWNGLPISTEYLVIIFEHFDTVSPQFMLDLYKYRNRIGVRRALSNSPLVPQLGIGSFPYVVTFKRDRQQAIFMDVYTPNTINDILTLTSIQHIPQKPVQETFVTTPVPIKKPGRDCARNPESCKALYYASETDMLKAMRMALYDEILRTDGYIQGSNLTNLHQFVQLLSQHFPVTTFHNAIRRQRRSVSSTLKHSDRARFVFKHLNEFLSSRISNGALSIGDWKNQFESIERLYSYPFPQNATWQHCVGSEPQYRGYTCGLWTTFHTLTVHTYLDTVKEGPIDVLKPLKAIQGWVSSFFGCLHCRNHFMHMTTTLFPMNERRVRHKHDIMMYLWRAHNIVNNRLHGDITEDPYFIKYQFPPIFLCPTCHAGGNFSRRQVRNFLLRYYGNIKPHVRMAHK
uniref:Sulfhydryl oxidase n=1 Tax=Strongyloides venezuelensis TaxID=75913 RepID=A0A0K0FWG8_STRVS